MIHNTFHFTVSRTKFYGQYWQPELVKAVVVLVHGMGEHSSRYEDYLVPKLVENGYAVLGYDNYGHGRTKGKRGHCPSYKALMNTLEEALVKSHDLFPNVPKYLYGHSLGGNLVINYVLRRKHRTRGVIATSPFLRLAFKPPKWKWFLGKIMLKIWPSVTLPSDLELDALSRDKREVTRYKEDPLVHDLVSPMFSFPIMKVGEWAIQYADRLDIPLLILHGTGDRITDHKASQEFASASDLADIKLFEDGYHELHHDICRDEVFQDILEWLKINE